MKNSVMLADRLWLQAWKNHSAWFALRSTSSISKLKSYTITNHKYKWTY